MNIEIKCYFITFATFLRRKILLDKIAEIVTNAILFGREQEWYRLYAFAVMPDHVHIAIGLNGKKDLSEILHSLKSWTSHEINKKTKRNGEIWQKGNYIEELNDAKFVEEKCLYIEKNPVKAGLIESAEDFRFCSAFYRERMDYEDWR